MSDRYKLALARGRDAYEKAVREDQQLLGGVGLTVLSVQNGLRVTKGEKQGAINPWDVIHISPDLWQLLRPLLLELTAWREEPRS